MIVVEVQLDDETDQPNEVFVSFDKDGLAKLQEYLRDVNFTKPGDDTMLMSEEWGRIDELSTKTYHPGLAKVHKIEFQLMMPTNDQSTE